MPLLPIDNLPQLDNLHSAYLCIGLLGVGGIILSRWYNQRAKYPQHRLLLNHNDKKSHRKRTNHPITLKGETTKTKHKTQTKNQKITRLQTLANLPTNPTALRIRQIISATIAALTILTLTAANWPITKPDTPQETILLIATCIGAYATPLLHLKNQAKRRQKTLSLELPDAIELLSLSVGAGQSLHTSIKHLAQSCTQISGEIFKKALIRLETGLPMPQVLQLMSEENDSAILRRMVTALIIAMERGTPLAAVLQEQAADSRGMQRAELLELGGRKEIWMMIPVVFMILPLTVLFALYPGLMALRH